MGLHYEAVSLFIATNSIFFPVHRVLAFVHVQEHALDAFLALYARDAVTLRSFASLQPAESPGWEDGQK